MLEQMVDEQRRVNKVLREQADQCAAGKASAWTANPGELLMERAEQLRAEAHRLETLGRQVRHLELEPKQAETLCTLLVQGLHRF